MSIDLIDIYRAAKVLIDDLGDGAADHAESIATTHLQRGDIEGHATWKRIIAAIRELSTVDRPLGTALN